MGPILELLGRLLFVLCLTIFLALGVAVVVATYRREKYRHGVHWVGCRGVSFFRFVVDAVERAFSPLVILLLVAISLYIGGCSLSKSRLRTLLAQGDSHAAQGEFAPALAAYTEMHTLLGASTAALPRDEMRKLGVKRAIVLARIGDSTNAAKLFTEEIQKQPLAEWCSFADLVRSNRWFVDQEEWKIRLGFTALKSNIVNQKRGPILLAASTLDAVNAEAVAVPALDQLVREAPQVPWPVIQRMKEATFNAGGHGFPELSFDRFNEDLPEAISSSATRSKMTWGGGSPRQTKPNGEKRSWANLIIDNQNEYPVCVVFGTRLEHVVFLPPLMHQRLLLEWFEEARLIHFVAVRCDKTKSGFLSRGVLEKFTFNTRIGIPHKPRGTCIYAVGCMRLVHGMSYGTAEQEYVTKESLKNRPVWQRYRFGNEPTP